MGQYLATIGIGLAVFLLIDLLWLGVVAPKIYNYYLGDFLADKPRWPAALIFYSLYVIGLVYFVIAPALDGGSTATALLNGALLGGLAYSTYELTNYAVIKDWPLGIVFIDIAWGMLLTGLVAAVTYALATRFIV